ncbi:MAG: DNA primase [Patescibacteria group bacterium]|nr:MAG: DNA primase [Patescibacteria group bacterium]
MIDQIEEIKRKLDIVALVSSYVPLQKAGKNYKALCPFHSEKTPSFMVSPQLQIFKCFGCGEGGDVIAFYSKIEGVSFGESLKEMAKRAGVKLVGRKQSPVERQKEKLYEINRLASDFFHFLLTGHKIGKPALEFLKKRGLSKESIEDFDLGYAPKSWDSLGRFILKKGYSVTDFLQSGLGSRKEGGRRYYDFFRGRVIFPLRSSTGRVVGFSGRTLGGEEPKDAAEGRPAPGGASFGSLGPKYINTTETPVFEKRRFLFNLDLAKQEMKKQKSVVLVEGEMDAIALYELGIKNVVATKGTAFSPEQIAALAKFVQKITICFDRDTAGLEATKKGILLAQGVGLEVRAVLLPEGQDPDEAARADLGGFKKLLASAPSVFDFYLASALARFNPADPSGKKKIAHEILPVVKSLANEVEKAAYLAKLSQTLGVGEEIVWKQLEKEKALEGERSSSSAETRSKDTPRLPKKESYLMAVLFSLPVEKLRSAQRRIALEDLTNPELEKVLASLRDYLKQIKRFRLENFSGKLDEDTRRIFEELVLVSLPQHPPEDEFSKALTSVKRVRLIKERRSLVGQVRKAEEDEKPSQVRKLQREILKLTKKIDSMGGLA